MILFIPVTAKITVPKKQLCQLNVKNRFYFLLTWWTLRVIACYQVRR